jgi:hypothetical protein
MKATLHRLYCDESGNTGPRLLQADQPFFVYAFVLLNLNKVKAIYGEVVRLYSEEGIQAEDLKSSDLWSSSRGLRRYERIGTLLAQSDALICFSVIEKRYQACALVVETFLDPAYNPSAPPEAEASKYRRWLADQLYLCLDNELLDRFLAVQKADDVAGMRIVGNVIARRLTVHRDDLVVDAGRRILEGLDDFFRFGGRILGAPTNHHLPAGQQAAFFPGLVHIDAFLRSLTIQAILVCDEHQQFGEVLKRIFEEACITGDNPYLWEFGATKSLTNIVGMEQAASDESFGVQLADLAAGLVNRVAVAIVHNRRLTVQQRRVVAAWRPSFAPLGSHFFMASNANLHSVSRTLFFQ